jgi:hypothetical protein
MPKAGNLDGLSNSPTTHFCTVQLWQGRYIIVSVWLGLMDIRRTSIKKIVPLALTGITVNHTEVWGEQWTQ